MFPGSVIDDDRPINERIEEMDTKASAAPGFGDFYVRHPAMGGVVVAGQPESRMARADDTAAFTTPAEMLAWLAEQYGGKSLASAEARADAVEENDAPRYVWKTRADFVAALAMALAVQSTTTTSFALPPPAAQARKLADIIDRVRAQGIGE